MADLIDRAALFANCYILEADYDDGIEPRRAYAISIESVRNAPTVDAVEVVRCKDCKYDGTWQCHMEYDEYYPEADIHHEMHGDDDFCSYGVKEDGDSNDE